MRDREKRSYDQRCGLAVALDVIGERWTLLIIRELLVRPRRYGELLDGLSGIGTNLLAERLAALTAAGVIRPVDPGRRGAGYELTELGQTLREPVVAMARLGLRLVGSRPELAGVTVRASWAMLAVEAMVEQSEAVVDESYQFEVDGEVFHVAVARGRATVLAGPAPDPVLRIITDAETFFDVGTRQRDSVEALLSQAVLVDGPPAAVPRCLRLLGLHTLSGSRAELADTARR